jgi:hypothetical protein
VNDRQATPIDECAKESSIHEIRKDGIDPFLIKREDWASVISPDAMTNSRCSPPVTWPPIATLKGSSVRTMRATSVRMSRRSMQLVVTEYGILGALVACGIIYIMSLIFDYYEV